jgi:hypothetical protein
MRIIATSDTHYPPGRIRHDGLMRPIWEWNVTIPDGDVFVHAGDMMRMGYPHEWPPLLDWLDRLPHKHKFVIPGNHDFHLQVYPGPALQELRQIGVTVLGMPNNPHYYSAKLPNGMSMLGIPFVTNLNRWAFNLTKEQLDKHMHEVWNTGPHDVIVSHMPPHGLLDSAHSGVSTGSKIYRRFLDEKMPKVWVCGHIHEAYGLLVHNQTRVYNVAMCNRDYDHVNVPAIIDV